MSSTTLIFLVLPLIFSFLMIAWISSNRKNSQMKNIFLVTLILLSLWFTNLILQVLFSTYYNVDPAIFENITYISACLAPIFIYFISLAFKNPNMQFGKKHLMYFIVPVITLLVLWTNKYHHLFYIKYSIDINETIFGAYFYIHSAYTYTILVLGLANLIIHSIKTSGIFSKQSILFFMGTAIPVLLNFLGTFKVITMSIYITPISFSVALLLYAISIFKYDFLNLTPIALELIVNTISDGYLVLDENNIIINNNTAFLNFFDLSKNNIKNKHIFELKNFIKIFNSKNSLLKALGKCKSGNKVEFEQIYKDKYFMTTISPIYKDKQYIGTLIFVSDITQHKKDMQIIQNNQTMLIEKERLASLGQMIGGIAHNLKTPIFSISGATEGMQDLVKEYKESITDETVTIQDHLDIAKDMEEWISKIKNYTAYMSDVITAVRGQAVAFADRSNESFTIEDLTKRVSILMKHELQQSLNSLTTSIQVDKDLEIKGNINSLVQVINNLISNSIQAYNGEPNNIIEFNIYKDTKNVIFSVKDYASGMNKEVQEKLFKEMITTKGKNGTGLGLFMSASNIKAQFNGDIKFTSDEGRGTTFNVIIPIKK